MLLNSGTVDGRWCHVHELHSLTWPASGAMLPVKTKSSVRGSSPVTWKMARLELVSAVLPSCCFPLLVLRLLLELLTVVLSAEASSLRKTSVRLWKWGVRTPK